MTVCPFATFKPIAANYTSGGRRTLKGFVPHVQVGNGSLYGFFNRPKPKGEGASADFWCSKAGVLEQYVDLDDQSWAQGSRQHNGNPMFVSCEFEGYPDEPMTREQIAKGGELIAWVRGTLNPFALQVNTDPDGEGITPHYVFGGGHTCPGPGPREGQFPDLVAAATPSPLNPAFQPPPPPVPPREGTMNTIELSDGSVFVSVVGVDGKGYWTQKKKDQDGWSAWAHIGPDGGSIR